MSIWLFIREHFWHVAPILAAGLFGFLIVLERVRALVLHYPLKAEGAFFEKIRSLVMEDRIAEAVAFCQRFGSNPTADIVREGLTRAHQPETVIEDGLKLAVGRAQTKIQARTPFLATIANVATLLGLLGTIVGLVQSFEAVGNASAQARSALLAQGISTAMNATMLGLGVAIPCMIAFSFLMNRTNKLNHDTEQAAVKALDIIKQRYYSAEPVKENTNGHAPRLEAV